MWINRRIVFFLDPQKYFFRAAGRSIPMFPLLFVHVYKGLKETGFPQFLTEPRFLRNFNRQNVAGEKSLRSAITFIKGFWTTDYRPPKTQQFRGNWEKPVYLKFNLNPQHAETEVQKQSKNTPYKAQNCPNLNLDVPRNRFCKLSNILPHISLPQGGVLRTLDSRKY